MDDPDVKAVTRPFDPAVIDTLAILAALEDQVTFSEMSTTVLSENVPLTMYFWVVPGCKVADVGRMLIDESVAVVVVTGSVAV